MTGEPSGSLFCFVSLPKRGQQKIHGCGTVLKIWRNPVLLNKMGALSGRRGEERASIGGKRRRAKRKRQRNLSRIFCVFSVC
jgi:hypothetical protein